MRRVVLVLCSVVAGFLLTGCGGGGGGAGGGLTPLTPSDVEKLFPVQTRTSWTYQGTLTYTAEVKQGVTKQVSEDWNVKPLATDDPPNTTRVEVHRSLSESGQEELEARFYRYEQGEVKELARRKYDYQNQAWQAVETYSEPIVWLKAGTLNWTVGTSEETVPTEVGEAVVSFKMQAQYRGQETVGGFNCYKVVYTYEDPKVLTSPPGITITSIALSSPSDLTLWFAPNIGIVKMQQNLTLSGNWSGGGMQGTFSLKGSYTASLVSYK